MKEITKKRLLERLEKLRSACSTHDYEDYGPSCPECPCGECEDEMEEIKKAIKERKDTGKKIMGPSQDEYCRGCILRPGCNVVLKEGESCGDRVEDELLTVAKGCLGYLLNLPSTYRPDDSWLKPLIAAIRKADAGKGRKDD